MYWDLIQAILIHCDVLWQEKMFPISVDLTAKLYQSIRKAPPLSIQCEVEIMF